MRNSSPYLARRVLVLGLLLGPLASSAQPGGSSDSAVTRDAPLSTGAWVAHGALSLVPLGGMYATSHLGTERPWTVSAQAGAGMLAGWLPSGLLLQRVQAAGPRWMELEVAVFGTGLVLTPSLAALGTWATGEWLFHGSRDRGSALLGAMGGAVVGTLLGVAVHELLERLVAPGTRLEHLRRLIALGFIGAGSTAGYQWGGGGPRPR
jgi:hypothetical protein